MREFVANDSVAEGIRAHNLLNGGSEQQVELRKQKKNRVYSREGEGPFIYTESMRSADISYYVKLRHISTPPHDRISLKDPPT